MPDELVAGTLNRASIRVVGLSCIWMVPVRPPAVVPTECTVMLAVSELTCPDVSAASLICFIAPLPAALPVLAFEQPPSATAAATAAAPAAIWRERRGKAEFRALTRCALARC